MMSSVTVDHTGDVGGHEGKDMGADGDSQLQSAVFGGMWCNCVDA